MPATELNSETPYENDRRARLAQAQGREERRRIMGEHREEVEVAVSLGRDASRLEERVRLFDDPESGFEGRVQSAKHARRVFVAMISTYIFIGVADFWLATPDVAETFANKAMSLVTNMTSDSSELGSAATVVTPVWLRIAMGAILTGGFLLLTAWIKDRSDESEERGAVAALEPGDDAGFSEIRRRVLIKRGLKITYMAALAGLLCFLYSYDLKRAELMQDVQNLSQETLGWDDLNLQFFDHEPEASEAENVSSEEGPEESGADFAKPAAVIYSLLWMLHGVLLLVPHVKLGEDRDIARFSRGKVEKQMFSLRDREERTLRNLLYRIHEHEGDLRDSLIREAQPLAVRINEAAGRVAMEVPGETDEDQVDSSNTTPIDIWNGVNENGEAGHDGDSQFGVIDEDPELPNDEDPYRAIFG